MDGRTRSSICMCTPSRTVLSSTRSQSSENLQCPLPVTCIQPIITRYTGFKEVIKVVALPDKPSVVALIDVDKVLGYPCLLNFLSPGKPDGYPATEVPQEHPLLGRHLLKRWPVRSLCSSYRWNGDARPSNWKSLQDAHSQGEQSTWFRPTLLIHIGCGRNL